MWGLLVFLIGIGFGYLAKGRQSARLLMVAAPAGLALGVVVSLLGGLAGLGLPPGTPWMLLSVVLLAALFVLGAWIGDLIGGSVSRTA